jgi:hypothetical protein
LRKSRKRDKSQIEDEKSSDKITDFPASNFFLTKPSWLKNNKLSKHIFFGATIFSFYPINLPALICADESRIEPLDEEATMEVRWIISYECAPPETPNDTYGHTIGGELVLYSPGQASITNFTHKAIQKELIEDVLRHPAIHRWADNKKMVLITQFSLRYRDARSDQWLASSGNSEEQPQLLLDGRDGFQMVRLHAVFSLRASTHPGLPHIRELHTPDRLHICHQEPSQPVNITTDLPMDTASLSIIVITPPHHIKCRDCKRTCVLRIRQCITHLDRQEATVEEYGTFSSWPNPTSPADTHLKEQAREWGWHYNTTRALYKGSIAGHSPIPETLWGMTRTNDLLGTVFRITYYTDTTPNSPNHRVATAYLRATRTDIAVYEVYSDPQPPIKRCNVISEETRPPRRSTSSTI